MASRKKGRGSARSAGPAKGSPDIPARLREGLSHHQKGRLAKARACYEAVLARRPDHPDALHFLGLVAHQEGMPTRAAELIRRAIAASPATPAFHLNLGSVLSEAGDPAGARACFREVIRLDPADAVAYFNLGLAEYRVGDHAASEQALRAFVRMEPGDAAGHVHLGHALRKLGRPAEAEGAYREAVRLGETRPEARVGLAGALVDIGRPAEAVELLVRAVERAPGDAALANALGNARRETGDWQGAIGAYRRAVRNDPSQLACRVNLAAALQFVGRIDEALDACRQALARDPGHEAALRRTVAVLGHVAALPDAGWLDPVLVRCWARADLDSQALATVTAHRVLERHPGWSDGFDSPSSAGETLATMAGEPLLLGLLAGAINVDHRLERTLTAARRHLLAVGQDRAGLPEPLRPLAVALALQGCANEHVFASRPEEDAAVSNLVDALSAEARGGVTPHVESRLVLVAMYRPPWRLPAAESLAAVPESDWSEAVRPLVVRGLHEPLEDRRLAAAIASIGPIGDATSRRVAAQYEENPYPRWSSLPSEPATSVAETLRRRFPDLGSVSLPPPRSRVLVAGCGTGQEPIALARQWPDAEVTAVDLSRASLGFAARMARRFGVDVRFLQGDILDLGAWGERFDVIVSVGVLHHLARPEAGWRVLAGCLRPGGFMKVGLYSERARAAIVVARGLIEGGDYGGGDAGIRRLRAAVLDGTAGERLSSLLGSDDFYSLSTCRDLLFHVMEHRFTLPGIDALLHRLELSTVGLEIPAAARNRAAAGGTALPSPADLDAWAELETAAPDTFAGMYRLWCRKGADGSA